MITTIVISFLKNALKFLNAFYMINVYRMKSMDMIAAYSNNMYSFFFWSMDYFIKQK